MKLTLLLSVVLLVPLTAEAGLPRVAISIPADQSFAVGLKAAEQCDVPGKLIVLPPLSFDFASGETTAGLSEEQSIQNVAEGSELWLHVVVEAGALTGNESEQEITRRVDALVKSLPLSAAAVRGLVVEIREPTKDSLRRADLFAFGLVRLALAVKGNNAGLRLAFVFPAGFIGSRGDLVRKMANYSDLLGITYGERWSGHDILAIPHGDAGCRALSGNCLGATKGHEGRCCLVRGQQLSEPLHPEQHVCNGFRSFSVQCCRGWRKE